MSEENSSPRNYSALVHLPGVDPERFYVTALVMRRDGSRMTPADLAALAKAVPMAEPWPRVEADAAPPAKAPSGEHRAAKKKAPRASSKGSAKAPAKKKSAAARGRAR